MALSYRFVAAVAAIAVAIVMLLGWSASAPTTVVGWVEVAEKPLTVLVATNGFVEPIEKAEIRARFDARVVEIPQAGAEIQSGGLLLKLDGGPVAAELAKAESQRLAALDSLREAKDSLRRTLRRSAHDRRLFRDLALTQERLDESLADVSDAEARVAFLAAEVPLRVASLDHRIAELRAQRDAAEVPASFDGVVYKTAAKRGQWVGSGDPVVWFADLERLRVRANVDQVDLGRVKVGQAVRITSNAYPGRDWPARIHELIPNVVKKQSRLVVEALANVEPPAAGLVPGMSVDIEIVIQTVPDALQVPSEAIYRDELGAFVYRVDDRRVHLTRVDVGRSAIDTIEIAAGLELGDRVVVAAGGGLRDGDRVDTSPPAAVGARSGD